MNNLQTIKEIEKLESLSLFEFSPWNFNDKI